MKFVVTVLQLVLLGVTTASSGVVADNCIDSGGVAAAVPAAPAPAPAPAVADEDGVKQRRLKQSKTASSIRSTKTKGGKSKRSRRPTREPNAFTPAPTDAPTEPLADIPTTLVADGDFGTLVAALTATNLVGALSAPGGPFTVLAPPDAAFAALPNDLVDCLLEEENVSILSNILFYHVANGKVLSSALTNGMQIPTLLAGESVTVDLTNDGIVKINEATVTRPDVLASNGVIHVINEVLIPPGIDVDAFLTVCRAPTPDPRDGACPTCNTDEGRRALRELALLQDRRSRRLEPLSVIKDCETCTKISYDFRMLPSCPAGNCRWQFSIPNCIKSCKGKATFETTLDTVTCKSDQECCEQICEAETLIPGCLESGFCGDVTCEYPKSGYEATAGGLTSLISDAACVVAPTAAAEAQFVANKVGYNNLGDIYLSYGGVNFIDRKMTPQNPALLNMLEYGYVGYVPYPHEPTLTDTDVPVCVENMKHVCLEECTKDPKCTTAVISDGRKPGGMYFTLKGVGPFVGCALFQHTEGNPIYNSGTSKRKIKEVIYDVFHKTTALPLPLYKPLIAEFGTKEDKPTEYNEFSIAAIAAATCYQDQTLFETICQPCVSIQVAYQKLPCGEVASAVCSSTNNIFEFCREECTPVYGKPFEDCLPAYQNLVLANFGQAVDCNGTFGCIVTNSDGKIACPEPDDLVTLFGDDDTCAHRNQLLEPATQVYKDYYLATFGSTNGGKEGFKNGCPIDGRREWD